GAWRLPQIGSAGERAWPPLPAGVIRITFAQLVRKPICFLIVTRLPKSNGGFVERAGCNSWIVVQQSDAFKSFAGVIKIPALQLDFTSKQPCFRVYAALGLQHHNFFSDLLCLVRFVSADLNGTECQ